MPKRGFKFSRRSTDYAGTDEAQTMFFTKNGRKDETVMLGFWKSGTGAYRTVTKTRTNEGKFGYRWSLPEFTKIVRIKKK